MASNWSIPKCGDVFASPLGDLIIFLGRRLDNETPIWSVNTGIRYVETRTFNNSFSKVVKRSDDSILHINLGLEEIQLDQLMFSKAPMGRSDKRPWGRLEEFLEREKVHERLAKELKRWESNRKSFRQLGTINSKY
jgi:hypothetical protein